MKYKYLVTSHLWCRDGHCAHSKLKSNNSLVFLSPNKHLILVLISIVINIPSLWISKFDFLKVRTLLREMSRAFQVTEKNIASTLPWEGDVELPEQRVQVVFHVPDEVSEASLCQLFSAPCLFAKQSKKKTRQGRFELVECMIYGTGGHPWLRSRLLQQQCLDIKTKKERSHSPTLHPSQSPERVSERGGKLIMMGLDGAYSRGPH